MISLCSLALPAAVGIPFRETHHISGAAVKLAEDKGCQLSDLTTQDLQGINDLFGDDVRDVWDFNRSGLLVQCMYAWQQLCRTFNPAIHPCYLHNVNRHMFFPVLACAALLSMHPHTHTCKRYTLIIVAAAACLDNNSMHMIMILNDNGYVLLVSLHFDVPQRMPRLQHLWGALAHAKHESIAPKCPQPDLLSDLTHDKPWLQPCSPAFLRLQMATCDESD